MSFDPFVQRDITLLDKTQVSRTVISVAGDTATGNLNRYRKTGSYTFAGVRKSRHGSITLRAKDGFFITKEPIMTRDVDFTKYLIEVQFFQPSKLGDTGHPDPRGRKGELVRYDLSEPVQDADEKGQLLTVTLTAIESRMRQSLDSESHRLRDPKQSFLDRVNHYGTTRGTGAPLVFFATDANINLPNDEVLKQDWLPGRPTSTHDLLVEIIDKLREPAVLAGDFNDSYFFFVTSPTVTNTVEIFAEDFGLRNATDRGEQEIILKPIRTAATDTYEKKHTVITENKKFRNVAVVRGANGAHDFPMDYARFKSDWEHAKIASIWDVLRAYAVGEYVDFAADLFKCIVATTAGESPAGFPAKWLNLSTTNQHTPLTNDLDFWIANLDGKNEPFVEGVSGGIASDGFHRGFSVDMNISNTHFDVASPQNPYLAISGKDADFMLVSNPTSLPAAQIVTGLRVIVSASGAGDFSGQNNRLAEFDELKSGSNKWHFSAAPVTDEFIHDRQVGRVIRFNGTIWDTASPAWDIIATPTQASRGSPFHPVKNIKLVSGPDGRANSAIEWEYQWDNAPLTGDLRNGASRWAGFSLKFPIPHRAQGSLAVGDIWKNSTMDFENLSKNPDGSQSDWNAGLVTEDLGNLRGVACKLMLDFRDPNDFEINGLANMSTVWWFRDLFNRVVFTKAKVRRNSQFAFITFAAGPNAQMQLHENRIEELFQIETDDFTYVFPFNDHLLQKEYSGVVFDWHFVKEMGMFYEGSYDENFYYKNGQNAVLDALTQRLEQAWAFVTAGIQGKLGFFIIDKCFVRLSEFRFIKDAYVSSATGVTADARVQKYNDANQFDYKTMQDISQGKLRRTEHYPQFATIDAYVDVRMRLGERFKASGSRWSDEKSPTPGTIREMVCAEYTIHEGENGTRMQVLGYTRFGQF